MKERPILFSSPMVRAILDGRKTQTRRIVKPQFADDAEPREMCKTTLEGWQTIGHSGRWWDAVESDHTKARNCPYGIPGDRLWVRETWAYVDGKVWYAADGIDVPRDDGVKLKPSIFMPRQASRLTLEITAVRVERLQDISEEDAKAEGVEPINNPHGGSTLTPYWHGFKSLWQQINGADSWDANPWVWVIEFRRIEL